MEIDSDSDNSTTKKSQTLHSLATGPLSSSISNLSSSSKALPSNEDFHFYYNFNEFKSPIKQIVSKTDSTLKSIASSSIWDKEFNFPVELDHLDEAYDWLVNMNDEIFERFDLCVDEFSKVRKLEEESGGRVLESMEEDGFQVVCGKKKKKREVRVLEKEGEEVKAVVKDGRTTTKTGVKPRVPFHIPSITRPQREFQVVVDNSNEPFPHVWLERSEDGERVVHPLESFSEFDFIDRAVKDTELIKPLPIERTPFKLVEEVKDLKELAAKLRDVNEFAVDLEHNNYRSFQGLTCLMQISTRFEDYVVDTLKLHAHIGPYLRNLFKDPSKKKVMHGADRDIVWLQRDFGIYVCNLFDTGQASRVLKLERNSLEYLLHHFVGVTANKEYQNADWRLRPIPAEMLKYAREDTHYLLHMYDLMRVGLLEAQTSSENVDALLLEVYKRSYDVCMQLYEKEIQTDTSYLYIYGVQGADLNSQQLAVVSGLCEWRDAAARAEDESTGFILPNKALLEIARQMPLTASKLRRLVNSRHPYVERNLGSVVNIIKKSMENASAFESIAEQLHKAHTEMESAQNAVVTDEPEASPDAEYSTEVETVSPQESIKEENIDRVSMKMSEHTTNSLYVEEPLAVASSIFESRAGGLESIELSNYAGKLTHEQISQSIELPQAKLPHTGQVEGANAKVSAEATVQVLKKPSRAFGALLGNLSSKRKLSSNPKVDIKIEKIISSVTLPFHSFWDGSEQSKPPSSEIMSVSNMPSRELVSVAAGSASLEDIISLENDSKDQESLRVAMAANDDLEQRENSSENGFESDTGDKSMSLSELSSSFQDCLQSMNQKRNSGRHEKPRESESCFQLKPFDYAAAREQITFGERREDKETKGDEDHKNPSHAKERRRNSGSIRGSRDEGSKEFQQPRRRMAFPPSGNRSVTFRGT